MVPGGICVGLNALPPHVNVTVSQPGHFNP